MIRGCSITPPNALTDCEGFSSSLGEHKDCAVTCDPISGGAGCNSGIDQVAQKFSALENRVNECYQCFWQQSVAGDVSGNKQCGMGPPLLSQPAQNCPMYADTACYTASSTHLNYENPLLSFEDDYRGCSPFSNYMINDTEVHCDIINQNNIIYETCKGEIQKYESIRVK